MQDWQKTGFCIPAQNHKGKVPANAFMLSNTASYTACLGNYSLFISSPLLIFYGKAFIAVLPGLGIGIGSQNYLFQYDTGTGMEYVTSLVCLTLDTLTDTSGYVQKKIP